MLQNPFEGISIGYMNLRGCGLPRGMIRKKTSKNCANANYELRVILNFG
jgi:hypothetical protein